MIKDIFENPQDLDSRDRHWVDELERRYLPTVRAIHTARSDEAALDVLGKFADELEKDPAITPGDHQLLRWIDALIELFRRANERGYIHSR